MSLKPKVLDVKKVSPELPATPDEIAEFIRDAANFMSYIEDAHLGRLMLDRDSLKAKIDVIEAHVKMRRERYLAENLGHVPKEYQKTASLVSQYVDYNVYKAETEAADAELAEAKRELVDVNNKITAWQLAKDQYDRAIKVGIIYISYAKAMLQLGGKY